VKIQEAVELYIRLRDRKAEIKAEMEAQVGEVQEKLDKIEAKLLEAFDKMGAESVKTEFGTAYVSVRSSVSVADRDAFFNFVRQYEEWSLLEARASKSAVDGYRAAHDNELPPGLSTREERVVNVRRS
jgi:hypothetical protein